MNEALNFAKELLKLRGLKQTSSRLQILSAIKEYNAAIPYSELQDTVIADRSTLYRTLNTLIDEGLIHKAKTEPNDTYYAMCGHECSSNSHSHQHLHFQCTICKRVTCEYLQDEIKIRLPNHQISSVEINAQGVCKLCVAV